MLRCDVNRYYEVKLTSQKTTVKEETVQLNVEDDERRSKGLEKLSTDVVRSDSDSLKTKDARDQSMEASSSEFVQTRKVHELPGKEWNQDEVDSSERRDEWEERSFVQTGVITTTQSSESVHEKNGAQWSERIGDEADSAFHKYRAGE